MEIETIVDMVNMLESGEEPLILKICMGTASEDEIKEWARQENITDVDSAIAEIQQSFTQGAQMAETIDIEDTDDNNNQNNNQNINDRLDKIVSQLDTIMKEVHDIRNIISNKSFKDNNNL